MADSAAWHSDNDSAESRYFTCVSLLGEIQQFIDVNAPRSLPQSRKNDLKHLGENLKTWYDEIVSIKPDEGLDGILERTIDYAEIAGRSLDCIRDALQRIYNLLSAPQSTSGDERASALKPLIIALKENYDNLANEDDIDALKMSPDFIIQGSSSRPFATHAESRITEGPSGKPHQRRAATDLQNYSGPSSASNFKLPQRSTTGMTQDNFRQKSSSAAPHARKPVATTSRLEEPSRSLSLFQGATQAPCEATRDKLYKIGITPKYSNRGNGPRIIYPVEDVRHVLLEQNTAEETFLCWCPRCLSLSQLQTEDRHFDKDSLVGKYASTFALLICLYKAGLISQFQKRAKCLTDGPLENDNLKFISDLEIPSPQISINEIIENQYQFHIKKFEIQHHSVELGPKEALPITEIQEEGRGAYGTVYSFEFIPGYAGKSYEVFQPRKFVRKVFLKTHVKSGIGEFNNLLQIYRKGTSESTERSGKWRHHIMEALAGYEHGDIYFIIFPFAESTLAKYLQSKADSTKLPPRSMWRQMEGIAGGLAFLHESYLSTSGSDVVSPSIAFHFDLKPENILIRNNVVMISDFGQSKFRPISLGDSSSGVDSDRVFFNYGPPEHNFSTYDKGKRKKSNYNFDIWSLGGIFSELITFHIKQPAGHQGVFDYRNARRKDDRDAGSSGSSTTFFLDKSTIKPAVTEQHEALQAEIVERKEPGFEGRRDLWLESFAGGNFFQLVTSMLSIITENVHRPRALAIQVRLGELCSKAESEADQRPSHFLIGRRPDLWQLAGDQLLSKELPNSSVKILCYYMSHGDPIPTQCVVLMKRLANRQIQILLLWHNDGSQFIQRQSEIVSHTSAARPTGVIIEYFGHPPTDADFVDLTAQRGNTDEHLAVSVRRDIAMAHYKVVPVTNSLTTCAAMRFINAEEAFTFQAALTGQYVVLNFSANIREGEIIHKKNAFTRSRPPPDAISRESLLQIWADLDLSVLLKRRDSISSTEGGQLSFDRVPNIHVAIITRGFLYLFKLGHAMINVPKEAHGQAENPITLLPDSDLYLDRVALQPHKGAIMVNIPEPTKHMKCDYAKLSLARDRDT